MEAGSKHPYQQRKAEIEFLTIQRQDKPTRVFKGDPAQEGRDSNH